MSKQTDKCADNQAGCWGIQINTKYLYGMDNGTVLEMKAETMQIALTPRLLP